MKERRATSISHRLWQTLAPSRLAGIAEVGSSFLSQCRMVLRDLRLALTPLSLKGMRIGATGRSPLHLPARLQFLLGDQEALRNSSEGPRSLPVCGTNAISGTQSVARTLSRVHQAKALWTQDAGCRCLEIVATDAAQMP